jgi:hypothetical protein
MGLERYGKIQRRSLKLRAELVEKWFTWFYDHTETFEGALGEQLAYLWPAIIKGHPIDVQESTPLLLLLRKNEVQADDMIWDYLTVFPDDGHGVTPQHVKRGLASTG